jgi:hypothetical protein
MAADPLNPDYSLGESFKPPQLPPNELGAAHMNASRRTTERDGMRLDDIEGTKPMPTYNRSRAPKDILNYSDVDGSTVRAAHLGRTGRMRDQPDPCAPNPPRPRATFAPPSTAALCVRARAWACVSVRVMRV